MMGTGQPLPPWMHMDEQGRLWDGTRGPYSLKGTYEAGGTWSGTVRVAGWNSTENILRGFGTVFIGTASTPRPPVPDPFEVRADELIERWKNSKGGWKKLRRLIIEALDEVSDE